MDSQKLYEIVEKFGVRELYSQATLELGTDLIVFCDLAYKQVGIMPREDFVRECLQEDDGVIWDEINNPAIESLPKDSLNQMGFWLIVALENKEVYCTSVGAYILSPSVEA